MAQILGNFLDYCEKHYFLSENCCASFLAIVRKIWAIFILTFGHTVVWEELETGKKNQREKD